MDTSGYNTNNSDRCPKCGAAKVFSAIRCPACGTDYAAVAPNRNAAGTNAGFTSTSAGNFDINASFSAYKKSVEPQADAAEAAVGAVVAAGIAGTVGTAAQSGESALSGASELNKPVEIDPIARKLQEMAKQESAQNQKAPMPGVYIPGASNQSSSYQGNSAQGTSYQSTSYQSQQFRGTQSQGAPMPGVYIPGASNQGSGNQGTSTKGSGYQNTAPQMRFQGRPDIQQQPTGQSGAQGGDAASQYASPYSGASYGGGITETDISGKFGKIVRVVFLLALLGVVVYGVYRLYNCDKNENGVAYSKGQVVDDMYVNDWAEIKIDLTKEVSDYTSMINDASIQSSISGMNRYFLERNAELKANFLAAKQFKDFATKTITVVPAIIVFTITDNSIPAKLFGTKVEDFFYEMRTSGGGPYGAMSLTKRSDTFLCGHSYETYCGTVAVSSNLSMNIYMYVRAIGNKMVLIYVYDVPGYFDYNTLLKCFVN